MIVFKGKKKDTPLLHLPYLFITSSFILVAWGAALYHAVYPFVQTALLENVHCVLSFGEVQGLWLWYIINPGPPLIVLSVAMVP